MTRVAAALIRVVCLVLVKSLLAASKLAFAVVNRRCPGYLDHAALGRSCTGSFCGDLLVGAVAHSWRLLVQGLTSLVFMCVHRADEYVRPPPSPVVLVAHDRPASHPQQCGFDWSKVAWVSSRTQNNKPRPAQPTPSASSPTRPRGRRVAPRLSRDPPPFWPNQRAGRVGNTNLSEAPREPERPASMAEKRHAFVHNGQKVFEWDQTLEEVNMYIDLPKGVPTKLFRCTVQAGHIEHDLTHPVKTDSSFSTIEDGEMHITLQKREKGKTWSSPMQGQGLLDPYATDQEQKRLMLQRFQEENPGFDFSQAQFSGNCPDPRTFMGGMRSD